MAGWGQTSRCFMVCSSPHSYVVCPSSLNPHFCIRNLHRPVPVRRRFRLDQVGHVSLEPGGSDSLAVRNARMINCSFPLLTLHYGAHHANRSLRNPMMRLTYNDNMPPGNCIIARCDCNIKCFDYESRRTMHRPA